MFVTILSPVIDDDPDYENEIDIDIDEDIDRIFLNGRAVLRSVIFCLCPKPFCYTIFIS